MTKSPNKSARIQLLLIAAVFFVPLIAATWMYSTGYFAPSATTNHGALLEPVVSIPETLPQSPLIELSDGRWVMLYPHAGDCGADCRDGLYRLRQTRLMLGSEMDRVARVFLHADSPPDRVFLESEHPGLETINDERLGDLLERKRPEVLQAGGIYLIDPLGNLIMYFAPDVDPRDLVDDLKHLLDLSRIG